MEGKVEKMLKGMKKVRIVLAVLLCLSVSGCSNGFAKAEYESAEKIAKAEDHYAKERSVANTTDTGCSITVSKFDGRETIWSDMTDEAQDMEMDFSFSLSKGKAKVVHIDDEGSVETVIECLPETSTDGFVTKTVSLTPGQNRLKLVGYDCEDIGLQILFTE